VKFREEEMSDENNHMKFMRLTFNDFRKMALAPELSRHEKVGFPSHYREGKENAIFQDICRKLPNLSMAGKNVLEIGPGCSALPTMLSELCLNNRHKLSFVDSPEMLSLLPKDPNIIEYAGIFPEAMNSVFHDLCGKIDVILAYSVIQYVYAEGNLWDFVDRCLLLLASGGEILFGDVPNLSMRKRFFSSEQGADCHRQFTGKDELPEVLFNRIELGQIDDTVVLSILSRARAQGFHAWVVPQPRDLPMANRREDISIRRP
jgi:hypothetical protein